jgi:hypothetical protein
MKTPAQTASRVHHFLSIDFLHEAPFPGELASLPGMRSVETAPIIRTLKRTGSVL